MESDDQTLVQLISGERGSGKTTLLLKEMRWALDNVSNLKILFVCPVFKHESTGKYSWLLQPKYMKKVTVFLKYKPSLCKAIVERNDNRGNGQKGEKKKKGSPLWLVLEDIGSSGEEFLNCPFARSLWIVSRHVPRHITIVLN